MKGKYQGIDNLELDLPSQVEYNRQKNVTQDTQISVLSSQVNEILSQRPSGFLPRVYYGLTRGAQTYRFLADAVINISGLTGNIGDAFEFISNVETINYIPAIAIMINSDQVRINIQGDYNVSTTEFDIINMRTGDILQNEDLGAVLATQYASYLGDYDPQVNADKQITVLYDLELNEENVVFASVDFSSDEIYNWVRIGGYSNGVDGQSSWSISNATAASVLSVAKIGDTLISGENFTYDGVSFAIGGVYELDTISPLAVTANGNIRGPQGEQGVPGQDGADGANGETPTIVDGNWYIGGVDTGVKAEGVDGADGSNGQAFQIQSGLYSTPDNWGQAGNTDPDGNALLQLPTLPQSAISGKGYVVYDPLTTPLEPFYDLYWANNGDASWTVEHPFSGIKGADGQNGYTPYIQGGYWYINGTNTGAAATGPQGPTGPDQLFCNTGLSLTVQPNIGTNFNRTVSEFNRTPVVGENFYVTWNYTTVNRTYIVSARVTSVSGNLVTSTIVDQVDTTGATGATGGTGPTGATPNISMAATALAYGQSPTVAKTGTNENPIFTLGIPAGAPGQGFPAGGTTGQYLRKTSNSDYATEWHTLGSTDVVGALGYTPYNSTNPSGYVTASQLLDTIYPIGSYRISNKSGETSFMGGTWSLVKSNVALPIGTDMNVMGTGKNLGITGGSGKNGSLFLGSSSGVNITNNSQTQNAGSSWGGTTYNWNVSVGVATTAANSGLKCAAKDSITGLYIYRRTA